MPGLEQTRVAINERGFIVVDEQLRTAEPSIFAIGDVVGEPMLAHKASHEGRVAVEVIAGENVAFQPRAIPAVVFTDPELAWAGLTEAQAEEGRAARSTIAKFPWGASWPMRSPSTAWTARVSSFSTTDAARVPRRRARRARARASSSRKACWPSRWEAKMRPT